MTQPDDLGRQLRYMAADAAVRRIAPGLAADPDAVLDSRAFHRAIDGLDPSAPGYEQAVTAAVRAVVPAGPRPGSAGAPAAALARSPAAGAAAGTPPPVTEADLARMGAQEVRELMGAGGLAHLGIGARAGRTGARL